MIIEFAGVPGSGKSTLAARYIALLGEKGVYAISRKDLGGKQYHVLVNGILIIPKFIQLVFTPFYWKPIYNMLLFTIQYPNRIYNLKRGFDLIRLVKKLKRILRTGIPVVLEQGLMQEIVSIAYLSKLKNNKRLKAILTDIHFIMCQSVYIECQLDEGTAVHRINSRQYSRSRLEDMPKDEQLSAMRTTCSNYNTLFDALRQIGSDVCVVTIDTNAPQDKVFSKLCKELDLLV